jgi:hypothetical protein
MFISELEAASSAATKTVKKEDITLKASMLDTDRFTSANALPEVTDPLMFNSMGVPSPEGLLSYQIFGAPGTIDRQERFAFIDLGGKYFNPIVFYNLIRLKRIVKDIIMRDGYGYFKSGNLTLVSEEEYEALRKNKNNIVGAGLNFLIKNIDKLKLPKGESDERDIRVELITKKPDNERFVKKCPVIPAIHRDVDFNSRGGNKSDSDINKLYSSLIRNTSLLKSGSLGTQEAKDVAMGRIQLILVDIYRALIEKMPKSDGFLQSSMYGKNVDYSGFGVLSAADYMNIDKSSDLRVCFDRSGIPLSHVISYYYPFIERWVVSFIGNMLSGSKKICATNKPFGVPVTKKDFDLLDIHPLAMEDFTGDAFQKRVEKYIKSPYTRFDPIQIKAVDKEGKTQTVNVGFLTLSEMITLNSESFEDDLLEAYKHKEEVRPITWTDVFYMAAVNEVELPEKHIRITRYPLKDHMNTIVTKVHTVTTTQTLDRMVDGIHYKYYPNVDLDMKKEDIGSLFSDTIQLSSEYLDRQVADHDGDTSMELAIWSVEGNMEAEEQMYSKRNLLDLLGGMIHSPGIETRLTFKTMTS